MTDHDERKAIAREVAQETVRETFEVLGVDVSTPESRQEFRELVSWLRSLQKVSSSTGSAALWIVVTLFVGGMMGAFWLGLKSMVGR